MMMMALYCASSSHEKIASQKIVPDLGLSGSYDDDDVGTEADEEWSEDDEADKTLSNTISEVSTTPEVTPRQDTTGDHIHDVGMKPKHHKRSATIATVTPQQLQAFHQQMSSGYNGADVILDKIDAEMTKMGKKKKPSKSERAQLKMQGVEFDTGDETSGVDTRKALRDGLEKLKKASAQERSTTDGDDTGLGTASLQDTDGEQPKVEVYQQESSEGEDDQGQAAPGFELDSDVAKQLDAKYKQILQKKSGDTSKHKVPKPKPDMDDADSVLTEDLLNSYKQYMVLKSSESSFPSGKKTTRRKDSFTDLDSVRTEDIAAEYQKTLVHPTQYSDKSAAKLPPKSSPKPKAKPMSSKVTRVMTMPVTMGPGKKKKRSGARGSGPSDGDSIVTEDFENQFHKIMVKQVASVPITSFDQMMVDSDLDTVKSHVIREKLQRALQDTVEESEEDLSSDESEDNMDTMDTVIQKQFQEMMKRGIKPSQSPWEPSSSQNYSALTQAALNTSGGRNTPAKYSTARSPAKQSRYPADAAVMDLRASNTDISLDDEAKELERESARIRQELECERAAAMRGSPYTLGGGTAGKGRSASASPYRAPSPGAYRSASPAAGMLNGQSESDSSSMSPEHLNATLYKLNSSIQNAKKEKYSLNNELKLAQQTLMHSKLEIKNLEQQVKQNRAKAEDVRTELMLAEFKRDSARKELEKVLADINGKRHQLREMEEEEEREESKQRENNNQQLKAAMSEREELVAKIKALEAQVTTLQGRERERAELERQLQQTKEDLFAEQKRARTHMDTVKEELSSQNSKLEEMQKEKDKIRKDLEVKSGRVDELLSEKSKLQEKYNKLETKYKQMENDKNSIIKEKSEEYEELRKRTQEQMIQSRSNSSQETMELRQQLHEVTEQLAALHGEANKKEEVNLQLREQVLELQHQLTDDSETKQALQEEFNKNLQNIQKEKEAAMAQAHLEAEQKKVAEIEAVRQEVSQQGEQLLRQAEARLMKQIDNLQGQLATKDVEVGALIDKIRQQENSYKKQLEHVRQDTHDKLLDSMRSERTKWEADKDSEVRHLLANMREETDRTSSKLRDDLNAERDLVDHQKRQISQMNMEIEDLKEQNHVAYRERLQAVDKVKENAEMEKEKELDFIREQIEKETQRAQERLRDTIRRQEEDMSRLRAEKQEATTREQEQLAQQQQLERMLVKEVNEECRRLADVLCMMPRKVSLSLYNNWNNKDGSKGGAGYTRTALTNALQNLRATNDDVRKLVGEAKSEINTLKDAVAKGERSKKEEVELMRQKMQTEKIQALESLKDRLIKEHLEEVDKLHKSLGKDKNANRALREKDNEMREIQKNMATWKAQQTEKLAKKFQEEMNRELEKRVSGHKKCQRDWEREKAGQQREIERLTREMQNMRLVSTLRQSGAGTAGYSANTSLNSRPSSPTFAGKFQTSTQGADSGQLRQLQNQVKQLQLENSTLRRSRALSAATSVPDLSNLNGSFMDITPSSDGRKVIALESQLSQAETRSRLAEERAKKNEQLLNQKMTEMSKLQSQLTQQTKELMQLERAYSQIQNKSGSSSHNSSRVSFAR